MSTLNDIINNTLFEKRDNLKLFYDLDVLIKEQESIKKDSDDTEQQQDDESLEAATNEDVLTEAVFRKKKNGVMEIDENASQSILTLNDLVDFMNDNKVGGKKLLSPLVSEILLIMGQSNDDEKTIEDVINEDDRVKVLVDYGVNKSNSIGVFLNKKAGSNAVSFLMRKDGKNLGPFNLKIFEQRLLMFSRM